MKNGEPIMFSTDRIKFSPATYVHSCGQMHAVKIKRGKHEWTVKEDEVYTPQDADKIQLDAFTIKHADLILAWNNRRDKQTKIEIIDELKLHKQDSYSALRRAEKYGLLT